MHLRESLPHAVQVSRRIHVGHVERHPLDTRTLAAEPRLRAFRAMPRGEFGKTIGGEQHRWSRLAGMIGREDALWFPGMPINHGPQCTRIEQWMIGQAHQCRRGTGKAFAHRANTGAE